MYSVSCWIRLAATLIFFFILERSYIAEARKLWLRPLNARQVYKLLRDVGKEDAVPEGRLITQGIAALSGFALGLTKGIAGSILFDIITANVTAANLANSINSITGSNGDSVGSGSSGGINSNSNRISAEEICFNTRSMPNSEDAYAVADYYRQLDGDMVKWPRKRKSGKKNRRNAHRTTQSYIAQDDEDLPAEYIYEPVYSLNDNVNAATGMSSGLGTDTMTGTGTSADLGMSTGTGIGTSTGSDVNIYPSSDFNSGTATSSQDTSSIGDKPTTTCIVVPKYKNA